MCVCGDLSNPHTSLGLSPHLLFLLHTILLSPIPITLLVNKLPSRLVSVSLGLHSSSTPATSSEDPQPKPVALSPALFEAFRQPLLFSALGSLSLSQHTTAFAEQGSTGDDIANAAAAAAAGAAGAGISPMMATVLKVAPPACFFFLQISGWEGERMMMKMKRIRRRRRRRRRRGKIGNKKKKKDRK